MKITPRVMLAAVLVAAIGIPSAIAAGLFSTLPIVGSASFCASTVTGTGGLGGITGQGQGSTGSICGQTVPAGPSFLTGQEMIPADTQLGGGASPQTVRIPVTLLGNYGGTPRNYLDNAALNITAINGTATVTGATTSALAVTNMSADRWALDTNVGSGAGRSAIVTSSPSPPTGFTNVMKVFRTSGALTQPVCVHQEIPSAIATQLAGQTVTFSAWLDALAGLAADNNNIVNMVVYTGTGTDQGFGSWTASPAITPAWTGIATAVNQALTITTTFTRYSVSASIPSTATEVGVAICFTPTATGAGATDGFAWTGAQLEIGAAASNFEVIRKQDDLNRAQQFFYAISETAGPTPRGTCHFTTANTACQWDIVFPQPMYLAPTFTFAAGFAVPTTTAETALTACTALAADATAGTIVAVAGMTHMMAQCTSGGTTAAVGLSATVFDNGGSGKFTAWAGM